MQYIFSQNMTLFMVTSSQRTSFLHKLPPDLKALRYTKAKLYTFELVNTVKRNRLNVCIVYYYNE